jgi:hypothetical protein
MGRRLLVVTLATLRRIRYDFRFWPEAVILSVVDLRLLPGAQRTSSRWFYEKPLVPPCGTG